MTAPAWHTTNGQDNVTTFYSAMDAWVYNSVLAAPTAHGQYLGTNGVDGYSCYPTTGPDYSRAIYCGFAYQTYLGEDTLFGNVGLANSGGVTPPDVGSVTSAAGTVTTTHPSGSPEAITTGRGVYDGDTITTESGSSMIVRLNDGSYAEVEANSVLLAVNDARLILQDGVAQFVSGLAADATFLAETVTGVINVQMQDGSTVAVQENSIFKIAQEIYIGPDSLANSVSVVVQEGVANFVTALDKAGTYTVETLSGRGALELPVGQVSLLPNSVIDLIAAGLAPGSPSDSARIIVRDGVAQVIQAAGDAGNFIVETLSGRGALELPAGEVSILPRSTVEILAAGFAPGSAANDAYMILKDGIAQFTTGLQQTGALIVETVNGTATARR